MVAPMRGRQGRSGMTLDDPSTTVDDVLRDARWHVSATKAPGGENIGAGGSGLNASTVLHIPEGSIAAGPYASETSASTCPDANDLDLTAGFCVAVDVTADWRPSIPQQILAKPRTGDPDTNDAYAVGFDANGYLFVEWYDGTDGHSGPSFITGNGSDVTYQNPDGVARRQFVYEFVADNGQGGWTARLYEGTPEARTLVATMVNTTAGAQSITTSTASLRVGDPCDGAVHRVRLYDELDGTLLRDFYPGRDWTSGTSMTSASTGEVWSSVPVLEGPCFAALTVPDSAELDVASGTSATWAVLFVQRDVADTDGDVFWLLDRRSGNYGAGGEGVSIIDIKVAAFASDFAGALMSDAVDLGTAVGAHWSAGQHLAVITINRGTNTATFYLDGASHATADISAVGAIDPDATLVLGSASHVAAAKWDRVLTAAELRILDQQWRAGNG